MTARDKLIQFILNMTDEQMKKLLNHPTFIAVMEEHKNSLREGNADAV